MSHAPQGGQAPDQANSGHQAGAAAHTQTNHSEGTHNAAGPLTSHMRHDDNQAGDGPRQTDPTSLTDALSDYRPGQGGMVDQPIARAGVQPSRSGLT